jgi:outer membrane protein assembly factor BamB
MAFNDPRLNRRSLLTFATAVTATGVLSKTDEATPNVEDTGIDPDAGGTPVSGTPVAGIELGDTIPPEVANATETDWPVEGRNYAMHRSAQGSNISSETVSGLSVAWTFEVTASSAFGVLVANPIVSGGTVFQQDANSNVYALNRDTGELIWENRYDKMVPSGGPNGIAVGYGAAVYPVGNGEVVAAHMETGAELWRVDITGPRNEGITTAPLIYDNKVWISTIPGDTEEFYQGSMRGMIHVLDMATGKVLWYFDTTKDNLWGNAVVNSGGGFWHPPAISDDGEVYFAIANAAPYPGTEDYPSGSSRPGSNDYANNVLKIDPQTGELLWNVNVTGREIFDLDNHLSPIIASVDMSEGYSRELIITSGKHGYVVALDPDSGAQHWRIPVGTHRNAHLQEIPEGEEVEVWPGTGGGVETPMAYQDNVVYAPIWEYPTIWTPSDSSADTPGFDTSKGKLAAVDATIGDMLWQIDVPSAVLAGATVVNDLVFTGSLDGRIRAYSVDDGSLVWSAQATAGLNAPLAVSGDLLLVPAGGPLLASEETEEGTEPLGQLIAYKLG